MLLIPLLPLLFSPRQDAPVDLSRKFAVGQKWVYEVKSTLHTETRQYPIQTFIPNDQDLQYRFTAEIRSLKADGIAILHYRRPTMTETMGETFNSGPKTEVTKTNFDYDITISPINEILDTKDLSPKKPPKKDGGGQYRSGPIGVFGRGQQIQVGQFINELYRLALNVGSLDSAVDFNPKLPFDAVKVGDAWKKTVGYEPQVLKGKEGKSAVQRLDYTFTFKGVATVAGKPYYRVEGALDLKTDLADFINQTMGTTPDESHLKSLPMELKQTINFYLDMKTKQTISAASKAEGGFKINVIDLPDSPAVEQTLKGSTTMKLVSSTPIAHR